MELLCIQSQEHPELPLAELKAVIECENIDAEIEKVCEGLVILKDISPDNLDSYYETLTRRLGYTHDSQIDTVGTERNVGTLILDNCDDIKVNLTKPKSLVRVVAFENNFYVAIERIKLN